MCAAEITSPVPGISFRYVDKDEAQTLTRIHEECFPNYWNRDAFVDFFSVSGTYALLAEKAGQPIAMAVYRVQYEQAEILTLAVRPAFRRRGIARLMLAEMLARIANSTAKKLFLEVENGNSNALNLYEKAGFTHVSRRKLYYRQKDGTFTDALVMSYKFP